MTDPILVTPDHNTRRPSSKAKVRYEHPRLMMRKIDEFYGLDRLRAGNPVAPLCDTGPRERGTTDE